MEPNLKLLIEAYKKSNVVPFIGSGLSIPFKIPSWEFLIRELANLYASDGNDWVLDVIEADLKGYDYWRAIDTLKHYKMLDDLEIQEKVVELILSKQDINLEESEHNYSDLRKLNCKLYLTTNYDYLLQEYLKFALMPINLSGLDINTQNLFEHQRVCHLHGSISNPGTIVLSRKSYDDLYSDKKYDDFLKLITGTKTLFFLGFSFDDLYIRSMIKEHKESFKGVHYILLDNPSQEITRTLKEEYRLNVISYDSSKSTHQQEIRNVLHTIVDSINDVGSDASSEKSEKKIPGAGLDSLTKGTSNFEDNLFYRKLAIENVDKDLRDLCTIFYIAADEYIRDMKRMGISLKAIDYILGQVFLEYKTEYLEQYKEHGNSKELIKSVHKKLELIDYRRYQGEINEYLSNKNENKGFIHLLADDGQKDIWWGSERIE